jgi:hypothetical protein
LLRGPTTSPQRSGEKKHPPAALETTEGRAAAEEKEWESFVVHRACPDGQVLESCEPVRFRCCLRSLCATTVMAAQIHR